MLRKLAGLIAIKQIVDRNFRGRGRKTGTTGRTPGTTTGPVNRKMKRGLRRKSYGVR